MPDHVPKVEEIGTSSAPLLSASFFIGARCRPYNDDFMLCKTESAGRGEFDCMKEGRKVTRCAATVLQDITDNCLEEFRAHWQCLENQNHQLWQCRIPERKLNKCVFEKIGLQKVIPGTPENTVPVHERHQQIFATHRQDDPEERWENGSPGQFMREQIIRYQLRNEFFDHMKTTSKASS